jgi:hypothetical protein
VTVGATAGHPVLLLLLLFKLTVEVHSSVNELAGAVTFKLG